MLITNDLSRGHQAIRLTSDAAPQVLEHGSGDVLYILVVIQIQNVWSPSGSHDDAPFGWRSLAEAPGF